DVYQEFRLTPVMHTLEDLAKVRVPYHLKIDTGMGRLGTRASAEEIALALKASASEIEGLMTHFASSANYESPQTDEQVAAFQRIRMGLKMAGIIPKYIHAASTIPVAYKRKPAWGNLVRPGHAIYGYVSPARGKAPKSALKVKPALTWKVTVL